MQLNRSRAAALGQETLRLLQTGGDTNSSGACVDKALTEQFDGALSQVIFAIINTSQKQRISRPFRQVFSVGAT